MKKNNFYQNGQIDLQNKLINASVDYAFTLNKKNYLTFNQKLIKVIMARNK